MNETAAPHRIHLTALVESAVTDADGQALGKVVDIMVNGETGAIAYIAIAVGGVLGVGERLFAVPWSCLRIDAAGQALSMTFAASLLNDAPGFDKDAWPAEADTQFATSKAHAGNAEFVKF